MVSAKKRNWVRLARLVFLGLSVNSVGWAQVTVAPQSTQPPAPISSTPPTQANAASASPSGYPVAAIPVVPTTVAPTPAPGIPVVQAPPPGYPPLPPGYRYVPLKPSVAMGYQPALELPYNDGEPIPLGYRVREEFRQGLVTGGYVLSSIGYGIGAMAAMSADLKNSSGFLLVPFMGPWLTIGRRNYAGCSSEQVGHSSGGCAADVLVVTGLVMDGLMQIGGGTMLLVGYLAKRKRLVRNDVAWSIGPRSFGSGYGIAASGTF